MHAGWEGLIEASWLTKEERMKKLEVGTMAEVGGSWYERLSCSLDDPEQLAEFGSVEVELKRDGGEKEREVEGEGWIDSLTFEDFLNSWLITDCWLSHSYYWSASTER